MGRTRKRPPLAALLLLLFLPAARCAGSLLDVVVNLRGADALDPLLLPPAALAASTMDNSDLFVAVCAPGTFSPDDGGVCHECQGCHTEQFETLPCLPYRDRACANCTACEQHEVEVCQCAVKTSQCFTGDRVCLKLKPTTVTLTVELRSAATLTARQEQLVTAGLATGFVDWLAEEFGTPFVDFQSMVRTAPGQYAAAFVFTELYNQTTVQRLKAPDPALYQRGLVYTFGGAVQRRRRLLAYTAGLVSATGSHSDCTTNTTCDGPYLAFQFDSDTGCGGTCVGVPCPPGLFGGFGHCADCAPGSYADAPGLSACAPCPDGLTSPPAANASGLCFEVTTTTAEVTTTTTTAAATTTTTTTTAPPAATTTTTARPVATTTTAATTTAPPVTTTATTTTPAPATTAAATTTHPVTTAAQPVTTTAAPPGGGGSSSGGGGSNYNYNNNQNSQQNSNANTNTNSNVFYVGIPGGGGPTKGPVYSNVINVMVPPPPGPYVDYYGHDPYVYGAAPCLLFVLLLACCFVIAIGGCPPPGGDYEPRTVIRYRLLRPVWDERDADGV